MSRTVSSELYFFLSAALTGVILSAVYDVLRIIRRVHVHGCLLVAIEDFIYWFGSALYISYVLLEENSGVIRWFFVLGIFLGMLFYNITISQYLVGIFSKVINKVLHVVEKVFRVLLKPFAFLWKRSKKVFGRGGKVCEKISKKLKKGLKNCCKTIKIGISRK